MCKTIGERPFGSSAAAISSRQRSLSNCFLPLFTVCRDFQITSKKMTLHEFIDNLCYTGFNYDRGLLKTLYAKIKAQPFKSAASCATPPSLAAAEKARRRPCPSNDAVAAGGSAFGHQLNNQVDYHRGWIMLKEVYDRDVSAVFVCKRRPKAQTRIFRANERRSADADGECFSRRFAVSFSTYIRRRKASRARDSRFLPIAFAFIMRSPKCRATTRRNRTFSA